ncbi:ATP-dependent helicase BRM-like protein, partial [Drosera capensis]
MQACGGTGGGAGSQHGRSPASSAASPSSSSSASQFGGGFDPIQQQQRQLQQQQQQQQQQIASRQLLQHQFLRKPEGNEPITAYQAGSLQQVIGSSSFPPSPGSGQLSQQQRKFIDFSHQQQGTPQVCEDVQIKNQGRDQQALNPLHQAYLQYAFSQQKAAMAMQPQQQAKSGMASPSGKDQDARLANMKMQEAMLMQSASQGQASSSKKSSEPGQNSVLDQRNESKLPMQQIAIGQMGSGNMIRPMQMAQIQQGAQNMGNSQMAMAAQMQAMQAWAAERNIDL